MSDIRRGEFRNRLLGDGKDVFQHNAWDHVEWDGEQEESARNKVIENSQVNYSNEKVQEFESNASRFWDKFYTIHNNRFFKNRNWLAVEFPELFSLTEDPSGSKSLENNLSVKCTQEKDTNSEQNTFNAQCVNEEETDLADNLISLRLNESYLGEKSRLRVLEVGCGAGNTVFPLLSANSDPNLFVYCCDFSYQAVDIVKQSGEYDVKRCKAFTCDVTSDSWNAPFPAESLDCIICIFVLSALSPEKIQCAIQQMSNYLKPGGMLLFRDYGRYDMAQLRFKKGSCLGSNFYARGDGTRCYFFTQDEVTCYMKTAGLEEVHSFVDRRLQVNRGKQIKMYRIWILGKYRKALHK